jgi:predicted phage tail protein
MVCADTRLGTMQSLKPIRVHLHGSLRQHCPEPVTVYAATPLEAVDAVTRQLPTLRQVGRKPLVRVLDHDSAESLHAPATVTELHLVPAFTGGKSGNAFLQIVLGTVLVVASFYLPASMPYLANAMFSFGASLVLGGVLNMISPAPKLDVSSASDPDASKYLGAPGNTVKIGTRIPLLFGRHKAYGHILSVDVDAARVPV